MKSVPAMVVFIAEKPAPVLGSKMARNTASCSPGGSVFNTTKPASRNEAPKPAIVWYFTLSSIRKSLDLAEAGSKRRGFLALRRSPAFEET